MTQIIFLSSLSFEVPIAENGDARAANCDKKGSKNCLRFTKTCIIHKNSDQYC